MSKLLTILFLLICSYTFAAGPRKFYVSNSGSDSNTGLSSASPWLTIAKVNASWASIVAGDTVAFQSGGTFTGTLTLTKPGTSVLPIIITSYDAGAKPIITEFTTLSGWTNEGGGIYSKIISAAQLTNMVTIDGVQYAMGRFPDATYLTYENFNKNLDIRDYQLNSVTNWTGAEVVIKKSDWTIERNKITAHVDSILTYTSIDTFQLPSKNYGYFIQNDLRTLTTFGEWFHNTTTGKFYMYFGAVDPTTKVVKMATSNYCITNAGQSYITIDGLNLTGSIDNAVNFSGNTNSCIIRNCTVSMAGNVGVRIAAGTGSTIAGNNIFSCNREGVSVDATTCLISNNSIHEIGLQIGQVTASGGYGGVYTPGGNNIIELNTIRNTGYNGISIRYTGGVIVRQNRIDSVCLVTDDGAGIYTSSPNAARRYFYNNIISNAIGATAGTDHTTHRSAGIYLDETSTNITVRDNTIFNIPSFSGIKLHKAHDVMIYRNTGYNTSQAIDLLNSSGANIRNDTIRGNIFCALQSTQSVLRSYSVANDINLFGIGDSNYYARPISDNTSFTYQNPSTGFVYKNIDLPGWRIVSTQDASSNKSPLAITNVAQLHFDYNPSLSPVTINFPGFSRIDMKGTVYNNSATVAAWNSLITLDSGVITSPTANAGVDKTITLPTSSTSVSGSATLGSGTTGTYHWAQTGGPTTAVIGTPNASSTGISNLTAQGTYTFNFTVTNNLSQTASDVMQVFVIAATNTPPVANAGTSPINDTLPTTTVTLDGSASHDAESAITYLWSKLSGPAGGTIANPTSSITAINSLQQGTYSYGLTVTDAGGLTSSATVTVIVYPAVTPPNLPPVITPGSDIVITSPTSTTTLTVSATDPEGGSLTYAWTKLPGSPTGGTIASATSATTGVSALIVGVYRFQVVVKDTPGDSAVYTVQVTVDPAVNLPPTVSAGADTTIVLPTSSATITGTASDPEAHFLTYSWTVLSGPNTPTFGTPTAISTTISGLIQGLYSVQLSVSDGVNTRSAARKITVNPAPVNQPPTANAGGLQTVIMPQDSVILSGSGTDPEGGTITYHWDYFSGPGGTIVIPTIVSPNSASTKVTGLGVGETVFQLTVTDDHGNTATSLVHIIVSAAPIDPTQGVLLYNLGP